MHMINYGYLSAEKMTEMLLPGGIDQNNIASCRIRWAYVTTRSAAQETRQISDVLKQRHLDLGAAEVLVHHAPWAT